MSYFEPQERKEKDKPIVPPVIPSTKQETNLRHPNEKDGTLLIPMGARKGPKTDRLSEDLKKSSYCFLFSHEPCIDDINQGKIGNCTLLATLQAIVRQDPKKIRSMMKDHFDKTATVRLFKPRLDDTLLTDHYDVKYYRVPKSSVTGDSRETPMWISVIEKAPITSGILAFRFSDDIEPFTEPTSPDEISSKGYKEAT